VALLLPLTDVMQQRMGSSLTYRHEDGINYAIILDDLMVGSCLQTPADVDRSALTAHAASHWPSCMHASTTLAQSKGNAPSKNNVLSNLSLLRGTLANAGLLTSKALEQL